MNLASQFVLLPSDRPSKRAGKVRCWRKAGAGYRELLTLDFPGPVRALQVSHDLRTLVVLLEEEFVVRCWRLDLLDQELGRLQPALGLGLAAPP